jgi:hypothetical protein
MYCEPRAAVSYAPLQSARKSSRPPPKYAGEVRKIGVSEQKSRLVDRAYLGGNALDRHLSPGIVNDVLEMAADLRRTFRLCMSLGVFAAERQILRSISSVPTRRAMSARASHRLRPRPSSCRSSLGYSSARSRPSQSSCSSDNAPALCNSARTARAAATVSLRYGPVVMLATISRLFTSSIFQ